MTNEELVQQFVQQRDMNKIETPILSPVSNEDVDFVDTTIDMGIGITRGPFEALKNSAVTLTRWLGDSESNVEDIAPFSSSILNMIDKPKTTAGDIAESLSTFTSGYLMTRGVGTTTFKASMVRGAITDAFVWDEDDGRISDLLSDVGVQNAVVDYLKHDPSDSKAEDSFKNVIEGALTGLVAEGVIKSIIQGYKGSKALLWANKQPEEVGKLLGDNTEVIQPTKTMKVETPIEQVDETLLETKPVDGVKPPETAFNYNNVQLDEDSQSILENITNSKDFENYFRTGTKPQDITLKEAESLQKIIGENPTAFAEQLVKDTRNMDSKLVGLKKYMASKVTELTALSNETDTLSTVKALKTLQELYVITGGTKATQVGAARTTAAGRIKVIPDEILDVIDNLDEVDELLVNKELDRFIDKATRSRIHLEVKKIVDINNEVTLHQGAKALENNTGAFTKAFTVLNEIRSAGFLSAPTSLGVNLAGNTIVRGIGRIEDYVAWGYGKAINAKDRLMWDELQAMSNGRYTSMLETFDGISKAAKHWKSGPKAIEESLEDSYLDFYQKYDTASNKALSSDYLMNLTEDSSTIARGFGHMIDTVGAGVRIPYHALGITDDMYKRSLYTGQISSIATRQANSLKLTGEARDKYISEFIYAHKQLFSKKIGKALSAEDQVLVNKYILKNKGSYHLEALEKSREFTFQEELRGSKNDTSINRLLQKIDDIRSLHPIGDFIVPFYRTPVNLLKWVGRRTPGIHMLSQRMTDDIKAGGRRKQLAYSRLTMGTSLYALGGYLTMEGYLVPGTLSEQERKSRATAGIQNYSIKIGDKFIEANRFDPIITPMLMSADLYQFHQSMIDRGYGNLPGYLEHFEEVRAAMITSFTDNILNKTWLKSVSDLVNAFKYGNEEYAYQALATFSPYSSLARFTQQTENYKEAKGLIENFQKIYNPYVLRDSLDVFGKPTKQEKTVGLRTKTVNDSPIRQEIARLQVPITKFDNKITFKNTTIELEPEDHWKLQQYMNTVFKLEDKLNKVMSSSKYKNAKDGIDWTVKGTKKYYIMNAINDTRTKARKYFLTKNKKTMDEYHKEYLKNREALENRQQTLMDQWLKGD